MLNQAILVRLDGKSFHSVFSLLRKIESSSGAEFSDANIRNYLGFLSRQD
jgi:hypothetical protein